MGNTKYPEIQSTESYQHSSGNQLIVDCFKAHWDCALKRQNVTYYGTYVFHLFFRSDSDSGRALENP